MRLITIRISHYNEKARWALDRLGVRYEEEPYMPMFHMPAVAWATRLRGRPDRVSTRLSTPVLVTDEGERICDSTAIVRWASDRFGTPETTLYPAAQREAIEAFERHLHDRVGPDTRRIVYAFGLADPELLARVAERNVGRRQARAFRLLGPVVMALVKRGLGISDERARRALDRLRREIHELSARVQGRPYLLGDRFSAADLSLGCMLAPVLVPTAAEGYGAFLPELDEVPPEAAALARELRQTPVGAFAMRMFATERGLRRVPCVAGERPTGPVLH